ncbi:MAG: SAM-dependent methyltransferase [Sandaracinaceae bacterium]
MTSVRGLRARLKRLVPPRVVFHVRRYASRVAAADLRAGPRRALYRRHGEVPDASQASIREAYADHLGGGAAEWEARGAYQVAVARELGLRPEHRLLEVGCGPGRASVHFAAFLSPERLVGFDQRPDYVQMAERAIAERGLEARGARFRWVQRFEMDDLGTFDYALAFSVLNHCTWSERADFFERIPRHLAPGGRLLVTHAAWLDTPWFLDWVETAVRRRGLRLVRRIGAEEALAGGGYPGTHPLFVFERA